MPEISRFYGIIVRIRYNDHNPPHVHVYYSGAQAAFRISPPGFMEGRIPSRAAGMVIEWLTEHEVEVGRCWDLAREGQPPPTVDPLR